MVSVSTGRDYNTTTRYEYVVFDGENVVARKGYFTSSTAAKRAGVKAAQDYLAKVAA